MKTLTTKNWNELSANLALRRNLESLLQPAENIGIYSTQTSYESDADYRKRIEELRERHRVHKHNIWQAYSIKNDDDAQKRIIALKKREVALWKVLYKLTEERTTTWV